MDTARTILTTLTAMLLAALPNLLFSPVADAAIHSCCLLDGQPAQGLVADAGNQCLSLSDGQYLIELKDKTNRQSFIVTPTVAVHAANALLIVQIDKRHCRLNVISGTVTAKNLLEHHIVELPAGTVYDTALSVQPDNDQTNTSSFVHLENPDAWLPLFRSKLCVTSIGSVSEKQLLASGIAQKFAEQLPRKDAKKARIVSPPTVVSYSIGGMAAKEFCCSALLFQHYPPAGTIAPDTSRLAADTQ